MLPKRLTYCCNNDKHLLTSNRINDPSYINTVQNKYCTKTKYIIVSNKTGNGQDYFLAKYIFSVSKKKTYFTQKWSSGNDCKLSFS